MRYVDWLVSLGVAGGASDPFETAVSLLANGECTEARTVTQDPEVQFPEVYEAAAAACLAAFEGRADLWEHAASVAAMPTQLTDCLDRAVAALLHSLVDLHRQDPNAQLQRKPAEDGQTFPCPRILQLIPDYGPPEGGYTIRVVGVHLPPVVVIHFSQFVGQELQDIPITTDSLGGTEAVVTVPRRLPGADVTASVYAEGWPFTTTNTPLFEYLDVPATAPTPPPDQLPVEPDTSPGATNTATPSPSPTP